MGTHKHKYRVNLSEQMAHCEANYARLLKLMPTFDECEHWHYDVQAGSQTWQIHLRVTERAPYTTTLEVCQQDTLHHWGSSPTLQVRLYHDARMAEVVSCQGHRRVLPRYDYPNRQMYQQDEKAQFNRFLSDWLSHSLAHGQSRSRVSQSSGT